jgi:hypothetical protein
MDRRQRHQARIGDRREVEHLALPCVAGVIGAPKTVRNHVSNVFAKIHATDRAHAIVLARRVGLGT